MGRTPRLALKAAGTGAAVAGTTYVVGRVERVQFRPSEEGDAKTHLTLAALCAAAAAVAIALDKAASRFGG